LIKSSDTAPSLDVLAQSAGMSRFHFHRIFKAIVGVTPKSYAKDRRRIRRSRRRD
jgi:AraC family transcriptional regulator of adaptative response/methylated-DNA-[protein]-cysteine methyltransferase